MLLSFRFKLNQDSVSPFQKAPSHFFFPPRWYLSARENLSFPADRNGKCGSPGPPQPPLDPEAHQAPCSAACCTAVDSRTWWARASPWALLFTSGLQLPHPSSVLFLLLIPSTLHQAALIQHHVHRLWAPRSTSQAIHASVSLQQHSPGLPRGADCVGK